MPLELGSSGKKKAWKADADERAAQLYDLICYEVRQLSLADRLRVFGAFKRGDAFGDLDPVVADAFRNVAGKL
jgi:hypothetical protein